MTSPRWWLTRATRPLLIVAAFVSLASLSPLAAEPEPVTPLARLKIGNERFVKGALTTPPLGSLTRQSLAKDEHPFAMVLSCADSRVPPEFIFNLGLGDLYVVRAAGEVVDRSVLATLEHGVEHLRIPLLVVMGHESCSVVKAALEAGHGASPNLDYLTTHIRAGIQHSASDQKDLRGAVLANVEQVINDAMSGSQIVKQAAASGRLQVVGAYYELGTGTVVFSDPIGAASATATAASAAAAHK
jgi:carbonic anhydrase